MAIPTNMLLYHGSNLIVNEPRLIKQARGLDFGAGFYLTSREQQAVDFTHIVMKRRQFGTPTISIYEFDEKVAMAELEILRFPEADAKWLEFVRDNRLRTYTGKLYDIIIGPVANDRVFPTIQAFIMGQFSVEATLVELKVKKLFDQYCFASERAIAKLKFIKSVVCEEK